MPSQGLVEWPAASCCYWTEIGSKGQSATEFVVELS
jgi:hypothetical protein